MFYVIGSVLPRGSTATFVSTQGLVFVTSSAKNSLNYSNLTSTELEESTILYS